MSESLSAAAEPSSGGPRGEDEDYLTVLRADGSADPELDPRLEPELARKIYVAMSQNRLLDERMIMLQRQGRIGFYIGSVGEEASILGSVAALGDQDWIFPCYREHGAVLWRGMGLETFVHNLAGTSRDPVKGRQMPCHECWAPGKFTSISSPIATQIPQAAGMAWAAKLKGDDVVALVYFGDGATSANDFHVGTNFAGVAKAPLILLCRNNHWAISVPREKQTAAATIAVKAEGYGIRGVRVDGNDPLAVYAVTAEAREHARAGGGPTLIEAVTYRVQGHSTSDDPRVYRKDDEVTPWKQRDPIVRFRRYLEALELWNERDEQQLVDAFKEELNRAIATVEGTPPPPLESMFEEVYQELPWHLREQRDELARTR